MPTVETKIWLALKDRIETLPNAVPVAYPGDMFTPPNGPWIAVGRVTQPPRRMLVKAGPHDRAGTLTLSYVAPMGLALASYEEKAGIIASHFGTDLTMTYEDVTVRITGSPHVAEGYQDDGLWRTPVNVRWQSYA